MKNFVKSGGIVSIVAAPYAVLSGRGCKSGFIFGIACADIASGGAGELATEGEFDVLAVGAQAWTFGDKIYWDDTAKNFTTTAATGNSEVARCTLAKANSAGATTGRVKLLGQITLVVP